MDANETLVTKLPTRIDHDGKGGTVVGRGNAGWTMMEFSDASEAAEFFRTHQFAAMPCWRRMEVVGGELMMVR